MRLALPLVLLCAAVAGLGYAYSEEDSAPTFITAPIERGVISNVVRATGTVDAVITVDVSSELSGRMAAVFVDFNDLVKAGQALAELDREIFVARVNEAKAALKVAMATEHVQQAALERARVAVINAQTAREMAEHQAAAVQARQGEAERELQRKLQLARTGIVADRDLGQVRMQRDAGAADLRASVDQVSLKAQAIATAEAELRMADANLENAQAVVEQKQAALDQAQVDLERAVVRAPIDGVIIKRDVNPGQTVAVSLEAKTLFKIGKDLSEMEVHGKIDEADVGRLRVGQAARFTVDAYPNRTFTGRLLQIRKAPEVVQNVVTYTAIISAPNPELLLLPGMTAVLGISISDTGETLTIPNQALRFRPDDADRPLQTQKRDAPAVPAGTPATVWVIGNNGRPAPVTVAVGPSDDQSTQVLAGGLTEGQPLIVGVANSQTRARFLGLRFGY
jgi:HlyD family secretion protein